MRCRLTSSMQLTRIHPVTSSWDLLAACITHPVTSSVGLQLLAAYIPRGWGGHICCSWACCLHVHSQSQHQDVDPAALAPAGTTVSDICGDSSLSMT